MKSKTPSNSLKNNGFSDIASFSGKMRDILCIGSAAIAMSPSDSQAAVNYNAEQAKTPPAIVQPAQRAADRAIAKAAKQVNSVDEVISNFDKNTHVYYLNKRDGQTPITKSQLEKLSQLLGQTDYYLVVVGQSAGYRYTGVNGTKFAAGKAAIEANLGQNLFTQEEFASITDSRLGTPIKSASLLILNLDERSWFWSSSELHDQLGLSDEQTFKGSNSRYGNLVGSKTNPGDFAAGRFADGIIKTVNAIEGDLSKAIQIKLESERQTLAVSTGAVNTASRSFIEYKNFLEDLNKRFPGRSGDLFFPGDIDKITTRLETAQKALSDKDLAGAKTIGEGISEILLPRVKALTEYPGAERRIADLYKNLETAKKNEFASIELTAVLAVESTIKDAEVKWNKGEAAYTQLILLAAKNIQDLELTFENAHRAYNVDGEKISALTRETDSISKSKFANNCSKQISNIKAQLPRVLDLWKSKDPAYPELLSDTSKKVLEAQSIIKAGEDAERSARNRNTVLLGLLGLLTLGGSLKLRNLRSSALQKRDEAKAKLEGLRAALQTKEEGLSQLERLQERALMNVSGDLIQFASNSDSAKLAQEARQSVSRLRLFQVLAQTEILGIAEGLINSGSWFKSAPYEEAIEILGKRAVEFNDKLRPQLQNAFNQSGSGVASLTVSLDSLANFKKSLAEIDEESTKLAKTAKTNLETIAKARDNLLKNGNNLPARISQARASLGSLLEFGKKDTAQTGLFTLENLEERFLKPFEAKSSSLLTSAEADPIGTWSKIENIVKVFTEIESVISTLVEKRSRSMPGIRGAQDTLSQSGLKTDWINTSLSEMNTQIAALIEAASAALSNEEISAETDKKKAEALNLDRSLSELEKRIQQIIDLNAKRIEKAIPAIDSSEALVVKNKKEIATAASISEALLMQEKDSDPDDFVKSAKANLENLNSSLSQGAVDLAQSFLKDIKKDCDTANNIADATLEAYKQHQTLVDKQKKSITTLGAMIEEGSELLGSITKNYHADVLLIGEGDPSYPNADDTIANNIEEMQAALTSLENTVNSSDALIAKGKILEAAFKLKKADEWFHFAENRLKEIKDKSNRLAACDQSNQESLNSLVTSSKEIFETKLKDIKVSKATIDLFNEAIKNSINPATKAQEKKIRNPFEIERLCQDAKSSLTKVTRAIPKDLTSYQEAAAGIAAASNAIEKCKTKVKAIVEDGLPDSEEAQTRQSQSKELAKELQNLTRTFKFAEHADWKTFITQAENLCIIAEENASSLAEELSVAKKIIKALEEATNSTEVANQWTGPFGVEISGQPGLQSLNYAHAAVRNGDYENALKFAKLANKEAREAVEEADDAVAKARRKRQAAAERRAEQQERRRSSRNSDFGGYSSPVIIFDNSRDSDSGSRRSGGGGGGIDISGGSSVDLGGVADAVSSIASAVFDNSGGSSNDW